MQHSNDEIWQMLLLNKLSDKKSTKQIQSAICILFGSPTSLVNKCLQLSKIQYSKVNELENQFNIQKIQQIYQSIDKMNLNKIIRNCLMKSLEQLQYQQKKQKQNEKIELKMQYFYIIIVWQKLYLLNDNKQLLQKCLHLIAKLPSIFIQNLNNLPANNLTFIVSSLHNNLIHQFDKLQPGIIQTINIKQIDYIIHNICSFLSKLNQSNNENKRTPIEIFINTKISSYFEVIGQYKLHLKNIKQLNFLSYPFLFNLDYKYKLLQIQSIYQQKMNMHKSLQNGLSGLFSGNIQTDINGNFSLEGLIYLHFQLNRNNILNDSMQKLCKVKQNLKSQMRISFVGQQGSDQGGVKNQYFQLVIKQIFNPYLDMFIPKNNNRFYWFNGYSFQPPIRFEFVGILLGLAIYNSVHLNLKFPNIIYKKLLNQNQQTQFAPSIIEDLKQIEPDLYRSFKQIIQEQQKQLQNLSLYFIIELNNCFGQKIIQQLVQDGFNIKVNQQNKIYYCQLYADYIINKHIKKQFQSFKIGFKKVVSGDMIKLFQTHQLRTIICGNQKIDFQELQANTSYQGGYTVDSMVIKQCVCYDRNLWDILHKLSIEDKKAFLVFITGTDRVPIDGLKSLGFIIQKHANTSNLPTSHTCFNVFLLPQYETKAQLDKNIRIILKNNQGFGLI